MAGERLTAGPVVYEVDLAIDRNVAPSFDDWLATHVQQMLALPGFRSATVERVETDDEQITRRSVRYRVADRQALETYFAHDAERMRADGIARFGDAVRANRRILLPEPAPAPAQRRCSNCAAELTGQYCYRCGQRDKHRLISLWELLRDLIGDLFEVDSRIWRTVFPLLFRPGFLTREYLAGRRVHYTPPLRMYLVLSLVFFLVAVGGSDFDVDNVQAAADNITLSARDDPADQAPAAELGNAADESPLPTATADQAANKTAAEAAVGADVEAATKAAAEAAVEAAAVASQASLAGTGLARYRSRCSELRSNVTWLDQHGFPAQLQRTCEKLTAPGGVALFLRKLADNIPAMMFAFLPLIALVMKFLYVGSRRYYVEHLLFVVHYHSFVFLSVTVAMVLGLIAPTVPLAGGVKGFVEVALMVYIPFYLFRAMRNVYGQWWIVRLIKFLVLVVAYQVSLVVTLVVGALLTALTV